MVASATAALAKETPERACQRAVGFGTAGGADGGAKHGPILVRTVRGGL